VTKIAVDFQSDGFWATSPMTVLANASNAASVE